jgi:cyclopropane fatty-acyl-phospholipid synthase-like methyltransferase
MENMEYFFEVYDALPRGGPGNNESTRRAFNALPKLPEQPSILDLGCGPGEQTIELAKISKGTIIALDNHQPFLDNLMNKVRDQGLTDVIIPKNMSMMEMDFADETFDLIWSEGALYFMGLQNGVRRCRQMLKPGGCLAFTDMTAYSTDLPKPLADMFFSEMADFPNLDAKIAMVEAEGFTVLEHFTLPKTAWLENYYAPIEIELPRVEKKFEDNETALAMFRMMRKEIAMYREYSDYFGYEFLVGQKESE